MILTLENARVRRGGVMVIHELSVAIDAASWTGLIGANGSGKTTLLRAIAGRLPLDGGSVSIGGTDVFVDRHARARRVGFAVDIEALPDELTPRELFDIQAGGSLDAAADPDLLNLKQALAIDRHADRRIGALSSGLKQRVAIYSAFVPRRGIVILDEPFNWLDPLTAFDTRKALRRLVGNGLTLITALHDLTTLALECDRGLLLSGGRLAHDLSPDSLADARRDPAGFEGRLIDTLRAGRGAN